MGMYNEQSLLSLPSPEDLRLDRRDGMTSDALALTRAAMRERCDIRVDGYTFTDTGRRFWIVYEDVYERGWFEHEARARAFADKLTGKLFDADAVGELL